MLIKKVVGLFVKKIKNNAEYIQNYFEYAQEFKVFLRTHGERFEVLRKDKYPCLYDKTKGTSFDKHYIYHTAWAARRLSALKPVDHTDISSLTYFSTVVSAFIPVSFYDYRPVDIRLDNLTCNHADITALPFKNNSIRSLSCMHVIEHIGLGGYSDVLDVEGDLKAISELKRVLSIKGDLFFVVPIGKAKIMFNAHRIYSYDQVMSYFNDFELQEFTLIPDQTDDALVINATKEEADKQTYACGCFWFKKKEG